MSLKKYKKVKYLGKGSYGAAILVHLRSNKSETFVIKEIVIGHMKDEERQSTMNEVDVLRQMHHSNIAMYVESFIEGSRLYIVMEHADGGDLSGAISRRKESGKPWPENEVMRMFVQICLALKHVHEQNILHRDLKSQNIFLTSKGIVKLGDFGIAKVLDGTDAQARTQIGTPYYLSPEICESKPYGRSSDMWSVGVVLFELMALELPFTAQSLPALVIKICTADPKWEKVEERYSEANIELCQSLLLKDCNSRPTVRDLLKSDYLMAHISKLLSHTIKMGKGGAEGAVLGSTNVDEVDRNIERERNRQKANEKVDKQNEKLAKQHAQHEADRDKLRKYKQEQARQKKKLEKEKSDEVHVAVGNKTATMQPMPEGTERSQSDVDLALAEAARREEKRMREQQEQYERMLHEQQLKHEEELRRNQQSQQRDDRYNERNRDRDMDRERDLPPRSRPGSGDSSRRREQQEHRDRDRDRDREGYRQHERHDSYDNREREKSRDSHGRGQQQRSHQDHTDGYMVVAKPKSHGSLDEGGEEMSAARREFFANRAAAQQIKAKIEAEERGGYKRGGGRNSSSGMEVALGGGQQRHQQLSAHPNGEYRHQQPRRQHGHSSHDGVGGGYDEGRAISGEERIAQVKAQRRREQEQEAAERDRQLQLAYEETRRERLRIEAMRMSNADESSSRAISGGGGGGNDDAHHRDRDLETSHADRQRKKELQKIEENRKHEELLRDARARNHKKPNEGAVAFSIDFSDGGDGNSDSVTTTVIGGSPRGEAEVGKAKSQGGLEGPSDQFRSRSNSEVSESESSVSTTYSSSSRQQRKGWGAPIAPPRSRPADMGTDTGDVSEVPDGTALRKLYGTSQAQEVEDDEEAVLKCLEARNGREEAARGHAKEVFRKLREKQRREAKNKSKSKGMTSSSSSSTAASSSGQERRRSDPRPPTRPPPGKSVTPDNTPPRNIPRKKSATRLREQPVNSDLPSLTGERELVMKKPSSRPRSGDRDKADAGGGSATNSRHASPSSNLARLNDVMGQVAKAQEEVSKVIADARDSNGNSKRGSRGSRGSLGEQDQVMVPGPTTPRRDADTTDDDCATGKATSSTQKTTVRNSYGRTGQRLSLGEDEIFAYSSGDDSDEAGNHIDDHERELVKTLDSWLSKDTLKSKRSEQNLLKSMKKGNSMRSMKHGASMKDLDLDPDLSASSKEEMLRADFSASRREAKATAEAKTSPRSDVGRDSAKGGSAGDMFASDDEGIDDEDYDDDDDDDEEEDGAVAGLQLLLAKALLSEETPQTVHSKNISDGGGRDDISL